MQIALTLTARINIHGLVGSLRLPVGQVRLAWEVLDKVRLTRQEEASVDLRRSMDKSREMVDWDVNKDTGEPVPIEFSDAQVGLLKEAFTNVQLPTSDSARHWIVPLLAALGL